jgi:hypothetical protein
MQSLRFKTANHKYLIVYYFIFWYVAIETTLLEDMMKITSALLVHLIISLLNQMQGNESTLENIVGFRRLNILDGYSCPVNKTIKVENKENELLCLIICSKLSSCNGVFISPDSKERCVMCSATFFTIDITQELSTTRQFYKRISKLKYCLLITS